MRTAKGTAGHRRHRAPDAVTEDRVLGKYTDNRRAKQQKIANAQANVVNQTPVRDAGFSILPQFFGNIAQRALPTVVRLALRDAFDPRQGFLAQIH